MLKRFSPSSVFSPSKQREMGLFHREKNHKGVEIFKSPHPSFISFYSFPLLIFHCFFIYFSSPRSLTNYSHLYFSLILLSASVLPFLHHLSLLLSISSFFLYISTFPSRLFTFSSSPPFIRPSPPLSSPSLSLSLLMNADGCSLVPRGLFCSSSAAIIEQEGWSRFLRAVLMIKAVHMASTR